jgi:hypothetical protein
MCLFLLALLLTGCENEDDKSQVKIAHWDNAKYSEWESSVGIDVYNSNSFSKTNGVLNKTNSLLYIADIDEPITIKFNNNGKNRNFSLTVFYDYEQIPFKITEDGTINDIYTFTLDDSYEIELPLFLPNNIEKSGSHKLLVSFSIGYDIHAMDLEDFSDWYGMSKIYDVTFGGEADFSDKKIVYEKPFNIVDRTLNLLLVPDMGPEIMNINIDTLPKVIEVKGGTPFNLTYRISTDNSEKVLLLVTVGFRQIKIDDSSYKLFKFEKSKTCYGDIQLTAPEEIGLYEVIALKVQNPFEKIQEPIRCDVRSSVRFTLKVIE